MKDQRIAPNPLTKQALESHERPDGCPANCGLCAWGQIERRVPRTPISDNSPPILDVRKRMFLRMSDLWLSPLNPRYSAMDDHLPDDAEDLCPSIIVRVGLGSQLGYEVLAGSGLYRRLRQELNDSDPLLGHEVVRFLWVSDWDALTYAHAETRYRPLSAKQTADWVVRVGRHMPGLSRPNLALALGLSQSQLDRYCRLRWAWDDLPVSWQERLAAPQDRPARLTLTHFSEVVSLLPRYGEPMDPEARKLLDLAVAERWSTRQLRRAVRRFGGNFSARLWRGASMYNE